MIFVFTKGQRVCIKCIEVANVEVIFVTVYAVYQINVQNFNVVSIRNDYASRCSTNDSTMADSSNGKIINIFDNDIIIRLKSNMLLNSPIILSGNSF